MDIALMNIFDEFSACFFAPSGDAQVRYATNADGAIRASRSPSHAVRKC